MTELPASPAPGWYADPGLPGHQRWWDGQAWTGEVFPEGVGPTLAPLPRAGGPAGPAGASPPRWVAPDGPAPQAAAWVPVPGPEAAPRRELPRWVAAAGLVGAGLLAGAAIVVVARSGDGSSTAASLSPPRRVAPSPPAASPALPTPAVPGAPPPTAAGPAAPAAASPLAPLGLQPADVPASYVVAPTRGGTSVTDVPTLDLCNATYPSEAARRQRLQVEAADDTGRGVLSTEAVQYATAADAAAALKELAAAVAACPPGPVPGAGGTPAVTTTFGPAPDAGWPAHPGISRQAYAISVTDPSGVASSYVAVFLARGSVLVGVYFDQPGDPQPPVAGQTTMAAISEVFAGRLAAAPPALVG